MSQQDALVAKLLQALQGAHSLLMDLRAYDLDEPEDQAKLEAVEAAIAEVTGEERA